MQLTPEQKPDKYATVLVAIVNNQRDLEIAREQHWYRIPVERLPRQGMDAAFLAFYQTRVFGPEKWSINYYAPTVHWEIVRRLEILPEERDHPRARELYYKVHLGDVQRLPRPIVSAKWRRITFIVTHWERLQTVTEIGELRHGTIWEERLWRALRRVGRLAEDDYIDDW